MWFLQSKLKFFAANILQRDYCNWGHLDKFDQSDYRKITLHTHQESWLWANQQLFKKKKNNKLLEARNLNIDSKRFEESKMFHQIMFFSSELNI